MLRGTSECRKSQSTNCLCGGKSWEQFRGDAVRGLGACALALLVERMVIHPPAAEAQVAPALEGFQFTAQHRKDDNG